MPSRLTEEERRVILDLIEAVGIREHNILDNCSTTQVRAWVRSALLGMSNEEIRQELLSHRPEATASVVDYIISHTRLKIIANLLSDTTIGEYLADRPQLKERLAVLHQRIVELKRDRRKAG